MANTSTVYVRIDNGLKERAENILSRLGISPSGAIQMLYSQIVLQQGMPFDLKIPHVMPMDIDNMTQNEIDAELQRGVESIKDGIYSTDDVDKILFEEFGI